ncbi:UvrD-helicase domain-containing protein, partial [Candidatus Saccharibacteria bacterium]|nr:UvrD-helicase domain-containing protein [Candidatus Saccharibacteria bacterium]
MKKFGEELARLNPEQLEAVEAIYGPVLVVAGPGTGKTQLLSLRVANILQETDASPDNILCLTFTEAGARNMHERLLGLIGKEAEKITISTYHEFAKNLITGYPNYFEEYNLKRTIDELGQHKILKRILDSLPFDDINRNYYRENLGVYLSIISDFKKHLLTPDDIE